ncbi:hypothetical protein GmRootV213_02490 [Variovorax sp. V213]
MGTVSRTCEKLQRVRGNTPPAGLSKVISLSGGGGKPFIQPRASTDVAAGSGGAAGGDVWALEVFTARSVKAAASAVRLKKDMGSGAPVEFTAINGR